MVAQTVKMLCPFHTGKTPSFVYSMKQDSFKCFGCNREGSIPELIEALGKQGRELKAENILLNRINGGL